VRYLVPSPVQLTTRSALSHRGTQADASCELGAEADVSTCFVLYFLGEVRLSPFGTSTTN
jgi:hypothetical protein